MEKPWTTSQKWKIPRALSETKKSAGRGERHLKERIEFAAYSNKPGYRLLACCHRTVARRQLHSCQSAHLLNALPQTRLSAVAAPERDDTAESIRFGRERQMNDYSFGRTG